MIFDQDAIEHDPFGYYSPRLLSEKRPSTFMPYYMDYPVTDTQWILNDDFTLEDKKSDWYYHLFYHLWFIIIVVVVVDVVVDVLYIIAYHMIVYIIVLFMI